MLADDINNVRQGKVYSEVFILDSVLFNVVNIYIQKFLDGRVIEEYEASLKVVVQGPRFTSIESSVDGDHE
jgi:hypothetical protein